MYHTAPSLPFTNFSLGNLATRVSTMVEQYLDGVVDDIDIDDEYADQIKTINELTKSFGFDKALEKIWAIVADANQLVDEKKPWELAKVTTECTHYLRDQAKVCGRMKIEKALVSK